MRLLPLSILLIPLFSFASPQQATIITRAGTPTAPLKYYFDLAPALADGANHAVRLTVSASNSEKTAIRFDSVKLFKKDGSLIGNNVASKTDALTANPYSFTFQNFGIAPLDLASVAGVQITFMDMGGENSTGKITVQGITVAIIRDAGEACVIADPILITTPPPPIPTITQLQAIRPLIQPGTHGDGTNGGGSGGSGGGGSTSQTKYPSVFASYDVNASAHDWWDMSNASADDGVDTTQGASGPVGYSDGLISKGFGFTIPTGATINGIEFTFKRKSENGIFQDAYIAMSRAESYATSYNYNSASAAWPTSYENKTFGGPTTLPSDGYSYAPSDVNNASFGVYIHGNYTAADTAHIDVVTMRVYYTPLGGSVYDSFMDLLRTLFRKIS